jgi:hypothetical protein
MLVQGRLFRFGEKSVFGDWVDKPSFMRVLNSNYFQDKLKRNVVLGCLTHKIRDDALLDETSQVPLADWLLAERSTSNVTTKIWVEGDDCYYQMRIMDNENGKEVQHFLEVEKIDLLPSVVFSVEDPKSKRMVILDILAIDLTTDPAFNTTLEVVKK